MRFDMDNLNPGVWFDMPEEGRICLKVVSVSDAEEINKKCFIKKLVEYKDGKRYETELTDTDKASNMTYDKIIVDWEGLYDKNGTEIKCTPENKIKLMKGSPLFASFVTDCIKTMTNDIANEQDAEIKN